LRKNLQKTFCERRNFDFAAVFAGFIGLLVFWPPGRRATVFPRAAGARSAVFRETLCPRFDPFIGRHRPRLLFIFCESRNASRRSAEHDCTVKW
jgi:hypothetical protein